MATTTYRQAGVDIRATDQWLSRLAPLIRSTHGPQVLPDLGQFAGLFRLSARKLRDPVLVSSTDGVGTKLKLAERPSDHVTIGVDVVAMNVNDVITYGAKPLFFLDYVAMGRISPTVLGALLRGMAQGCRESGCALLGGETAEMPGCYDAGQYDVAGFCVGVADRRRLIDGSSVRVGDVVVGLASSGVHANGFSLVRSVLNPSALARLKRHLMVPTRLYVKSVLAAVDRVPVAAIAHVTGGGVSRRLPSLVAKHRRLQVRWAPGRWPIPEIFRWIQHAGRISSEEMYATFNMGIGLAMVCRPQDASRLIQLVGRLGDRAWVIGEIEARGSRQAHASWSTSERMRHLSLSRNDRAGRKEWSCEC